MKIELFSYNIPFVEPFQTAAGTFKRREGIIIRLKKDGITALGEASPLPSFSNETLDEVLDEFHHSEKQIKNISPLHLLWKAPFNFCNLTRIFPPCNLDY